MKKIISIFIAISVMVTMFQMFNIVSFAETIYSGTTEYNGITVKSWDLDTSTGVLNVYNRGDGYIGANDGWANYKAYVKTINIQNGITYISGFSDCPRLTTVNIPNSVTSFASGCFSGCSGLKEIELPTSIQNIAWNCFGGCANLTDIVIPNSVKNIYGFAFSNCSKLQNINLSSNLVSIGNMAFQNCVSLESISFPSTLKTIENDAFYGCTSLLDVELNEGLETIEEDAFKNCVSLTSFTMPDTVTCVEDEILSGCTNLKSIKFSYGIINVPELLFYGCDNLKDIYFSGTILEWQDVRFPQYGLVNGNCAVDYCDIHCSDGIIRGHSKESRLLSVLNTSSQYEKSVQVKFGESYKADKIEIYCSTDNTFQSNTRIITENVNSNNPINIYYYDLPNSDILYFKIRFKRHIYDYNYYNFNWSNVVMIDMTNATDNCEHKYSQTINKATTSADGKKVTKCTVCGNVKSTTTIKKVSTVKLSATKYTYDGKVKSPALTVKDSTGKALVKGTDYTVTVPTGRKNVGKYTYKITFKGNYSGTKSLSFTIVPKGTTISSLSAVSKGFTVKWKKQATQTTGYQIQIATDSKFTKGVKSYDVTKNSTVSKKITKLTGKKKYYVRIRTYKTISGTKYYSAWSSAKTVTTKK